MASPVWPDIYRLPKRLIKEEPDWYGLLIKRGREGEGEDQLSGPEKTSRKKGLLFRPWSQPAYLALGYRNPESIGI